MSFFSVIKSKSYNCLDQVYRLHAGAFDSRIEQLFVWSTNCCFGSGCNVSSPMLWTENNINNLFPSDNIMSNL